MSVTNNEDLRGAYIDERIVCSECIEQDEDEDSIKEDQIITSDDVKRGDKTYLCERCGKQL